MPANRTGAGGAARTAAAGGAVRGAPGPRPASRTAVRSAAVRAGLAIALSLTVACPAALAQRVYQPPGANLTYGDVTHGQRVQSASSNPAAAAADRARGSDRSVRGTVLSGAAGIEYGNVEELFEFIDEIAGGYEPSDPGSGTPPGQEPDEPDDGIDLGELWDQLDPDVQEAIEDVAREVATQASFLALIKAEGYAKAFASADVPFVLGKERFGGAWTVGYSWSGAAKSFGLADDIDFDEDAAREALEEWLDQLPIDRPTPFPVSDEVLLDVDPQTNFVRMLIANDSSLVTKAVRFNEFNVGYSRSAWSRGAGELFVGAEAHLYLMDLSRLSVRFGDISDSEELFDAIRDNNFSRDTRVGFDVGALWVAERYQVGGQLVNVNEPRFQFPEVDLEFYENASIIDFLRRDQTYEMDRQLKLEASVFTRDRRWAAHLGLDVDPATDPLGDRFQWLTLSGGFRTDSWWVPGVRFGYRENLVGTEVRYLSVGLTAFKLLNIDIASALDSVSISGDDLPRGLMASIGFQIAW